MGGGDLSPLHMGERTSAGGQALMGELMRGDIDLMGGTNLDTRLYHKLNVLLMLSCNYMIQFIEYDYIKTRFISYRFQIRTITQHQYQRIGAINRIM